MIEFDRIESYSSTKKGVIVSFKTDNRGIFQCSMKRKGVDELMSEPPIETLRTSDQKDIENILLIVYTLTYGEPPEDLS